MSEILPALRAIAREARRRILSRALALKADRGRLLAIARAELARAEPLLARTLKDAQLAAWLDAAKEPVRMLALPPVEPTAEVIAPGRSAKREIPEFQKTGIPAEPVGVTALPGRGGTRPPLPPALFPPRPDDAAPVVRLPAIERAARFLATRLDYTPAEFAQLDDQARAVGFTVAKAQTLDAVEKVRKALAQDVAEGGTLKAFRQTVREALDGSALADHQVEALYRTHTARAYSAGQIDVLDRPFVSSEFPYLLYDYTHDSRVRPEHVWLGTHGLNKTGVYRRDDPFWKKWFPPCGWNCRCVAIALSVEDAAARGVREARVWQETGEPPDVPEWVPAVPFDLPKGWVPVGDRLAAAV